VARARGSKTMSFLRPHPLLLAIGLTSSISILVVVACSTDNGDNSHGPDVAFPRKDATVLDGKVVLPDGNIVDPPGEEDGGEDGSSSGGEETGAPCNSGSIAVLAGSDTALGGSFQDKNGPWATSVIANGAAKSKPSVVAFGAGFLGVTHGAGDALQSTTLTGATWSAATSFGNAGVKGSPTLALVGTQAHVVYAAGAGANRDFAHAIHDGVSFNAGTAAVGSSGSPLSFGTVSAGLAGAGADAVFAENGSDEGLYVRSFTGGAWAGAAPVTGAGTVGSSIPATPELVAVEGKWDLLLVYVEKTTRFISFAMRDATTKVWADGDSVGNAVTTNEKLSLSRVGQFTVIVTFRGQDGKGYYTQGTIGPSQISWSAAAAIGGTTALAVDSAPAAARGVCGDDAVAAFASGGSVSITRLRGTSWTTPQAVTNLAGNRVAIATKP